MKHSLFLLFLIGCTSAPKLVVKSQPEKATVSYFNQRNLSYEELGKTPFSIDPQSTNLSASEINSISVLKIEKPGYVSENVLIPSERMGNSELLLNLKENEAWINKESSSISRLAEDMARKLLSINRLTSEQQYDRALILVNDLLKKYPEASIFYDMKGSLHLLRNERGPARQSFQRSLELRPDNIKTRQALENLK